MKVFTLCKRRTSSKDLMSDRFGRYFHLPVQMTELGASNLVVAADYRAKTEERVSIASTVFTSVPLSASNVRSYDRRIRGLAQDMNPEVVYAGGDIHLGWFGRRLARHLGVPFAFDVFDNYDTFTSGRVPMMKRIFRDVASSADLVVVVSEGLADIVDNASYRVIPNGVDMDLFRPAVELSSAQSHRKGRKVGYIGGVARYRGIETLIRSVEALRRQGLDLTLVIAGPVEGSFQPPRHDWIDYRGFVDQGEVPAIILDLDVAVLPYPDTEWARYTSPYKALEYLACEVPVVVTDVSGFRGLAANADAVCRPGDVVDMTRAIEYQLDHRRIVARTEEWSWRSRASELLEAFRSLAA